MADKEIVIVYYGTNGDAAKDAARAVRADRRTAQVRHAEIFDGVAEPCHSAMILSCVSGHDAGRIRAAYGDKAVTVGDKVAKPPGDSISLPAPTTTDPISLSTTAAGAAPFPPPPPPFIVPSTE